MPVLPALAGCHRCPAPAWQQLLRPPSSHRNALNFPSRLPAPGNSAAVRNPEEKALQNTQIIGGGAVGFPTEVGDVKERRTNPQRLERKRSLCTRSPAPRTADHSRGLPAGHQRAVPRGSPAAEGELAPLPARPAAPLPRSGRHFPAAPQRGVPRPCRTFPGRAAPTQPSRIPALSRLPARQRGALPAGSGHYRDRSALPAAGRQRPRLPRAAHPRDTRHGGSGRGESRNHIASAAPSSI